MMEIIIGSMLNYLNKMLKVSGLKKYSKLMIVLVMRGHQVGFILMGKVIGKIIQMLHYQEENVQ